MVNFFWHAEQPPASSANGFVTGLKWCWLMGVPPCCFVKDTRARQEKHCKILASIEIKTFWDYSVPRSTASNAHWPSKLAAHWELAWGQQAKFTRVGKYLFLCLLPEATHPKALQSTSSDPPLLWLSELLGANCTGDTLLRTIAEGSFPCSPSILPLQITMLPSQSTPWTVVGLLFQISPQVSFVHCTPSTS